MLKIYKWLWFSLVTLAIGTAGAKNAGLLAVRILSLQQIELAKKLQEYSKEMKQQALAKNSDLIL